LYIWEIVCWLQQHVCISKCVALACDYQCNSWLSGEFRGPLPDISTKLYKCRSLVIQQKQQQQHNFVFHLSKEDLRRAYNRSRTRVGEMSYRLRLPFNFEPSGAAGRRAHYVMRISKKALQTDIQDVVCNKASKAAPSLHYQEPVASIERHLRQLH
jgi:hypothetical protein